MKGSYLLMSNKTKKTKKNDERTKFNGMTWPRDENENHHFNEDGQKMFRMSHSLRSFHTANNLFHLERKPLIMSSLRCIEEDFPQC